MGEQGFGGAVAEITGTSGLQDCGLATHAHGTEPGDPDDDADPFDGNSNRAGATK
jgi:hypothetical protein